MFLWYSNTIFNMNIHIQIIFSFIIEIIFFLLTPEKKILSNWTSWMKMKHKMFLFCSQCVSKIIKHVIFWKHWKIKINFYHDLCQKVNTLFSALQCKKYKLIKEINPLSILKDINIANTSSVYLENYFCVMFVKNKWIVFVSRSI